MKLTIKLTPLEVSEAAWCFGVASLINNTLRSNLCFDGTMVVYKNDKPLEVNPSVEYDDPLFQMCDHLFDDVLHISSIDTVMLKNGVRLLDVSMSDLQDALQKFGTPVDVSSKSIQPSIEFYAQFIEYGEFSFELTE